MAGKRSADLEIAITADSTKAVAGFSNVDKAAKANEESIKKIGQAAGIAFAAVTAGLAYATKEAIKAEEVDRRLDSQLKKLGISSEELSKKMKDTASAIQNMSNYGDEQLKGTMTNLLMVTKDYNAALEHTQTAADLAARRDISLEQASQILGMAYVGNTARLKQYGIVLEDGVKGMKALEAISKEVAGGAAENIKPFEQLKNTMSDLAEVIGKPMVESAYEFARAAKSAAEAAIKFNQMTGGGIGTAMQYTAAVAGLVAGITLIAPKVAGAVAAVRTLTTVMLANPALAVAAGLTALATVAGDLGIKYMDNASAQASVNARTTTMIEKTKKLIKEKEMLLNSIGEENQETQTYIKTNEMIIELKKKLIGLEAMLANEKKNTAQAGGGTTGGGATEEAIKLKEGLQAAFDSMGVMTDGFTAEQIEKYNAMYLSRAEMQTAFDDAHMAQISEAQKKEIEMATMSAEQRMAIEAQVNASRLAGLSQMFGNLATIMNSGSRNMFEIGKAAAIAQAVVDTYASAQSAYSSLVGIPVVGPALGIAAAAAAVVAGTMRVTQIQATEFKANSGTTALGGGGNASGGSHNKRGAAEGVYDFRDPGNNENLVTTIREGESIIPRTWTDAMRTQGMSLNGASANKGGTTLQLIVNGDIIGVPKDEFWKEGAQRLNELIQSGDISTGQLSGSPV